VTIYTYVTQNGSSRINHITYHITSPWSFYNSIRQVASYEGQSIWSKTETLMIQKNFGPISTEITV